MSDARLLLGVDVGTYSTKEVLTGIDGTVIDTYTVPHGVGLPRAGWAQQDADAVT